MVVPVLAVVFRDFQSLVVLIDDHVTSGTLMSGEWFQFYVSSIQSRLLGMKDLLQTAADECLCFGMLALLTTMFRVPTSETTYDYLDRRLRDCCQRLVASTSTFGSILFWLLIVSRISVFRFDEPWLRARWHEITPPGMSWAAARRQLQSVIWIGCIHDEPGQQAFDQLNRRPVTDRSLEDSATLHNLCHVHD